MKKILSAVLTVAFCCSLTVSAFAVDSINTQMQDMNVSFLETVESHVERVLGAMEIHKSQYGLGDVDFDSLSLGVEIPAYELTSAGLASIDDIHYFPVLSNDEWVATAIVSYGEGDTMNVEVSVKYADIGAHEERVALVFDAQHTYLYNGDQYEVAETYDNMTGRVLRNDYTGRACPAVAELEPQTELAVIPAVQTQRTGGINGVSLGVPAIVQPSSVTCWAASIASILNYYGEAETVASVCQTAGVSTSTYMSTSGAASVVADYGYDWGTQGENNHYYYSQIFMDTLVTENYYNSSPIFAGFQAATTGGVGHAVVIQGYVGLTYNTVSYMDPTDGLFKSSTVPTSGNLTITVNGTTRSLNLAFAVYG